MTSKERLLKAMRNQIPDRVPATPDMSNMIPAKLTNKPFWDIYLYQDPPLWLTYIDAVKLLKFDGFLDYQVPLVFPEEVPSETFPWKTVIVQKNPERIVTREYREYEKKAQWSAGCTVYPVDNPPTYNVPPAKIGLPEIPESWEELKGVKEWPSGPEAFYLAYELMGDLGVVGTCCGTSAVVYGVEGVYEYYDNPDIVRERSKQVVKDSIDRFHRIMQMEIKPDYISCGGSGSLVFQSVDVFRDVSLPVVQAVTSLCKQEGIISHIHSCGPEKELVRICAEETDLDFIDPLEVPPMGDCDLTELKRLYGSRLALKGNLHTTEVMLKGSYDDVLNASRTAIESAKTGGGFILSTGDQCGRDTPLENIQAMIDACELYGQY